MIHILLLLLLLLLLLICIYLFYPSFSSFLSLCLSTLDRVFLTKVLFFLFCD